MNSPVTPKQMPTSSSGGLAERLPQPVGTVALGPAADGVLDAEAVENSYAALLSEYPDAPVAAVKPDGLFVEPPESLPIGSHPRLQGRSGLDLVAPEDRGNVILAWDTMLAQGVGQCVVHLAGDPAATVTFHFFDARPAHGVCLHVITPAKAASTQAPQQQREIAAVMPRFATMRKNERGVVLEVDDATTQMLGWDAEHLVGHRTLELTHPDDRAVAIENWMDLLAAPGPARRVRLRYQRRDESWVWFEITNHNLLDDPDHRCVVSGMLDISDEMAANEALRAREQLLDRLAEALPVGLFQIDSARHIVYANDRFHEIVGIERANSVEAQLSTVIDVDRPALEKALDAVLGRGLPADIEVELKLSSRSEPRFCTMNLRALSDEAGTVNGAIVCVADVTDAARMRDELNQRATFDTLTGCLNRASLMLALESDVARRRGQPQRAVIFLDLDGFKQVNDTLGHAAGDELLAIAGKRLKAAIRDEDLVGRLGGDEFLVLCPQMNGPERASKLAERLATALNADIRLAAGTITLQASVGVAWSEGHETTADALVAQADAAMYESKRLRAGQPRQVTTHTKPAALRARPATSDRS
jgi:diguanylate cyclase (GGDEF)-like protein/PAS domain S-box-containing protein